MVQASGQDAFWMCLPVEVFQTKWEVTLEQTQNMLEVLYILPGLSLLKLEDMAEEKGVNYAISILLCRHRYQIYLDFECLIVTNYKVLV